MTTSFMLPTVRRARAVLSPVTSERPAKPRHKLVRFAGIGGVATVIQLGLFAALLTFLPQFWANLISWTASTVVANTANRSVTFGVHGTDGARRDFWVSGAFSALSLVASMAVLAQLTTADPVLSVVALIAVNATVGLARFAGLKWWFAVRTV